MVNKIVKQSFLECTGALLSAPTILDAERKHNKWKSPVIIESKKVFFCYLKNTWGKK